MNELIVSVLQKLVALNVLNVKMGIKRKPLMVLALIFNTLFAEVFLERFILLLDIL
jgi:hypothetical protein